MCSGERSLTYAVRWDGRTNTACFNLVVANIRIVGASVGVVFSESQSLVVSVAAFRFPFCSNGVEFRIVETYFGPSSRMNYS